MTRGGEAWATGGARLGAGSVAPELGGSLQHTGQRERDDKHNNKVSTKGLCRSTCCFTKANKAGALASGVSRRGASAWPWAWVSSRPWQRQRHPSPDDGGPECCGWAGSEIAATHNDVC